MFTIKANGYDQFEVEDKITEMEIEIVRLNRIIKEKDSANLKLVTAMKKGSEVESSSQNLYKLKLQKITILFQRLEKNFNELQKRFPQLKNISDINDFFNNFSTEVKNILKDEYHSNITSPVSTENDTIRLLLNKMSTYAKQRNETTVKTDIIKRSTYQETLNDNDYKINPSQIKPISNLETDDDEALCDKFLQSTEENTNAYTAMLSKRPSSELYPTPNESGFDLKEAVNPKEDLSEIMKAFNVND